MAVALETHPLFRDAPLPALRELVAASERQRFAPRHRILSDGEPANWVFALESGAVRVFHATPAGDEVVVKVFFAPALFGEAEALSGTHYVENVDAIEPSVLWRMPVAAVHTFLDQAPACTKRFLIDVAARLTIASYSQKSLAFLPVTVRLANYLLDFAEWTNPPGTHEPRIALTQDEMAAAVGATRRAVANDIGAWIKEGIVRRTGRFYCLVNVARLRQYGDSGRLQLIYSLKPR